MNRSKNARPTAAIRRGPGTVRIIGGAWKRRVLPVVEVEGLRPTPDRVRETLFNWLNHVFGGDLRGLSVLDLFAGSGALGFEAASRGATDVVLVESNPLAIASLEAARSMLDATGIDIRQGDATATARALREAGRQFDLVLLDPPFGRRWIEIALPLAAALCKPSGCIYVEAEAAMSEATWAAFDLELYRADKAGEVFYHLLRRNKKNEKETAMLVAVYPGTFDPLTRGHEDLVRRASKLCQRLVVGVADSRNKHPFFTLEERVDIAREVLSHYPNVTVAGFSGLLKHFVEEHEATVVIRGLRAVSDFEFEFQMAAMNRYQMPSVETVFLTPSDQYMFISGTIVREIAILGGDVSKFTFPSVEKWLKEKVRDSAA